MLRSKTMAKTKNKKNVITFDNSNGEGCAINLNDFDYAEIVQIKTSDIFTVEIWNNQGYLIGDYIVTSDVAEKINSALEKVTKKRDKMKPKIINKTKKVVQFTDICSETFEALEEDIYGVEIQVEYDELVYYAKIRGYEDIICIKKETYDFFLKILKERVAAKDDK